MKIAKENIFNLKKELKKNRSVIKTIQEWMVKAEVKKSMEINFSKANIS